MFWLLSLLQYGRFENVAAKMVIRAPNVTVAREIAATNHGDEGLEVWYDPAQTTCVNLADLPDTTVLVVRDFING